MANWSPPLTAINIFAGIGGLTYGLRRAAAELGLEVDVVEHIDISTNCRDAWHYNNPRSRYVLKDVCTYTLPDVDIWLMSPPCQPYTKGGAGRGDADARAQPLLHIVDALQQRVQKPTAIFLENVPGFLASGACAKLQSVLADNYEVVTQLMSPVQLGIPYTRERVFLIAVHKSKTPNFANGLHIPNFTGELCRVSDFIDRETWTSRWSFDALTVAREDLFKMKGFKFDMISAESREIGTITGSYGERLGRQGPLISITNWHTKGLPRFRVCEWHEGEPESLRKLSPSEIMRFHGWPSDFGFPPEMSLKVVYKLLGNSVSIDVVAHLMTHMLRVMKLSHINADSKEIVLPPEVL